MKLLKEKKRKEDKNKKIKKNQLRSIKAYNKQHNFSWLSFDNYDQLKKFLSKES